MGITVVVLQNHTKSAALHNVTSAGSHDVPENSRFLLLSLASRPLKRASHPCAAPRSAPHVGDVSSSVAARRRCAAGGASVATASSSWLQIYLHILTFRPRRAAVARVRAGGQESGGDRCGAWSWCSAQHTGSQGRNARRILNQHRCRSCSRSNLAAVQGRAGSASAGVAARNHRPLVLLSPSQGVTSAVKVQRPICERAGRAVSLGRAGVSQ